MLCGCHAAMSCTCIFCYPFHSCSTATAKQVWCPFCNPDSVLPMGLTPHQNSRKASYPERGLWWRDGRSGRMFWPKARHPPASNQLCKSFSFLASEWWVWIWYTLRTLPVFYSTSLPLVTLKDKALFLGGLQLFEKINQIRSPVSTFS
jgi:hypothetical protein